MRKEVHFTENFGLLMELGGYTYQAFSDEVGVNISTVYKWYHGELHPQLKALAKISEILKIDLETLVFADLKNNLQDYAEQLKFFGKREKDGM